MEETNNSDVETEVVAEETEATTEAETEETDKSETVSDKEQEETFFDPNTVPEELKPAYKQMQSAFTKKTQEIAESRKALENFERYKPLIEKLNDPQNAYLRQVLEGKVAPQGPQYPTDPIEYAKWVENQAVQRMKVEQDRQQAAKVDPRLNEDPVFSNMVLGIVNNNPDYLNGKVSAVEATTQAVKAVDEMVSSAKKSGKAELTKQATQKANKYVAPKGTRSGTVNKKMPKTMQEAAEMAREQIAS